MPPETTPQTAIPLKARIRALLQPPAVYGVVALFLIGMAAFVFMYAYMESLIAPRLQAAAAAAAVPESDAFEGIELAAKAAVVVDLASGQTLYARNADAQLPLASLTKVPMALAVSEVLPPESHITIPYDTAPAGALAHMGAGESWKVRDVINLTLVASSNNGAEILAHAANAALRQKYPEAPETGATVWRMNNLAQELQLQNTYFINPSGLDESTTQSGAYGSARDMATLFGYAALSKPDVFAGTAEGGLLLSNESGATASAVNTNEALGAIPGLIMGKTGFTDLAGGNLAVVFDVGLGHPIVVVAMGSTRDGRFEDVKALIQAARKAIIKE